MSHRFVQEVLDECLRIVCRQSRNDCNDGPPHKCIFMVLVAKDVLGRFDESLFHELD